MTDLTKDIAALLRDRPRPGDGDETSAAWFDRKAAVFAAIAEQGGPDSNDARCAADEARADARRLRGGGGR